MKSLFFIAWMLLPGLTLLNAQTLLLEDFEAGTLPANWTQSSNATDGGWQVSDAGTLSSQFWPITSNGSDQIAATNDDACNCNKRADYLVSPPLDLRTLSSIAIEFDFFLVRGLIKVLLKGPQLKFRLMEQIGLLWLTSPVMVQNGTISKWI